MYMDPLGYIGVPITGPLKNLKRFSFQGTEKRVYGSGFRVWGFAFRALVPRMPTFNTAIASNHTQMETLGFRV